MVPRNKDPGPQRLTMRRVNQQNHEAGISSGYTMYIGHNLHNIQLGLIMVTYEYNHSEWLHCLP